MKIAIIGAGNLGLSIAKGLIVNNAFTTLYLTKRKIEELQDYEEYSKVTVTKDNREAVQNRSFGAGSSKYELDVWF